MVDYLQRIQLLMKEHLLVAPRVVVLVVILAEGAKLNFPTESENWSVSDAGELSNSSLWSVLLAKIGF